MICRHSICVNRSAGDENPIFQLRQYLSTVSGYLSAKFLKETGSEDPREAKTRS